MQPFKVFERNTGAISAYVPLFRPDVSDQDVKKNSLDWRNAEVIQKLAKFVKGMKWESTRY
jgi:hypothetical protein